jgi:hypothetical protein
MGSSEKARRRRLRIAWGVLAAAALLEIASRLIALLLSPPPGGNILNLYAPHPYRVYALVPHAQNTAGHISVNSHGFRGPEIALRKPPDTVRIACLGDSTTFNDTATTDGRTYPAQLERMLREHSAEAGGRPSRIEVINAGVNGYTSLEALIYFETRLLDYQLDLAIFHLGLNDAVFMTCFRDFASDYTHARKVFDIPKPRLWEHSAFLSLLLPRGRSIANPFRRSPSADATALIVKDAARLRVDEAEQRRCFRPERIAIFERNVRNFVAVARGQGVTPILSTIVCGPQAGFFADVIALLNQNIRRTAALLAVPCVDLAREMPWSAEAFMDAAHPRDCPEGLERMGRIFADFLARQRMVEQAVAKEGGGSLQR